MEYRLNPQDYEYKKYIHDHLEVDMIDKSLHEPINSDDEDYIMRKIRENYLSDSTVTIFIIGTKSAEKAAALSRIRKRAGEERGFDDENRQN